MVDINLGIDERLSSAVSPPVSVTSSLPAQTESRVLIEVNMLINERLFLVSTPAHQLEADAIIVGNNENLSDRTGVAGDVFSQGGPGLEREVASIGKVRTGHCAQSGGHELPARHVIHAVGPRYRADYAAAAESALHWSYRSSLEACVHNGLSSVGVCPLHTEAKAYPPTLGAHTALRTMRRFLEQHTTLSNLTLVLPQDEDMQLYRRLVPLYFPRNHLELAHARSHLPEQLGDKHGEITCPERRIRILAGPGGPGSDAAAFAYTASSGTCDAQKQGYVRHAEGGVTGDGVSGAERQELPSLLDEVRGVAGTFREVTVGPDERWRPPRKAAQAGGDAPARRQGSQRGRGRSAADPAERQGAQRARERSATDPAERAKRVGHEEPERQKGSASQLSGAGAASEGDEELEVLELSHAEEEERARLLWKQLLARAHRAPAEMIEAVERAGVAYESGRDVRGRATLVVVGSALHARCGSASGREGVLLLLVRWAERLLSAPFSVVFVASGLPHDSEPAFALLRSLLDALPAAARARLAVLYVVHPSLSVRLSSFVLGLFLQLHIEHIDQLEQLHRHFAPGELWLPDSAVALDKARTGAATVVRAAPERALQPKVHSRICVVESSHPKAGAKIQSEKHTAGDIGERV